MARRKTTPPLAPAAPPRGPLWAALVLSAAGLGLAVVLTRLHAQAHAGVASFCTVNDVVNCDRVATSPYSVVLGLPVSIWGVIGYALSGGLAAWGLASRRSAPTWPTGLLVVVAGVAVAASVALALVSELLIGALCILCAASWFIALGLLAAAWRACRPAGALAAIRADLSVVRASPARSAAFALAGLVALGATSAAYPRYWKAAVPSGPGPAAAPTPPASAAPRAASAAAAPPSPRAAGAAPAAPVEVLVYTDYECPFCARQHEEVKSLLAGRNDVRLVHRQFPLDSTCNPVLKTQMHPSACALARAAVCAGDQGRNEPMADLLFRNQRDRQPVEVLAERAGLDVARFRECVRSPDTARRVADDIAAGLRDGVKGTPTYVAGGKPSLGVFPVEILAPLAGAGGSAGR
jgi:protein-disulfide isomerase/uncharacterized membrane protein